MRNDKTIQATLTQEQVDAITQADVQRTEAQEALERWLGTYETYGGIPVKPNYSIGVLKQLDNYNRKVS